MMTPVKIARGNGNTLMNRFEGKVAIVTGAASGIGKACAERLGAEGAKLFCLDMNAASLAALAEECEAAGMTITTATCDISNEAAVNQAVADCLAKYGSIDVLIHMAGVLRFDNTHELDLAGWQRLIDVNVTGTFLLNKAVLPHLVESQGNIVNAASTAALSGLPYGAAYSASKGAVLMFTKAIAVEYGKRGVRANCVCPGDIKTNMTNDIPFPEGMDMKLLGRTMSLLGPTGPDAVSNVVAMLASYEGRHINGESIRVDGATLA
jgi:NAD(P)-dependent dehydrogenase (short-subunit alcohol dehydrogenase family)